MFQTRSEETGIHEFNTLANAMAEAKRDNTIWKISFDAPTGERVRLVKTVAENGVKQMWVLSDLMDEVREELKVHGYDLPVGFHGMIDG